MISLVTMVFAFMHLKLINPSSVPAFYWMERSVGARIIWPLIFAILLKKKPKKKHCCLDIFSFMSVSQSCRDNFTFTAFPFMFFTHLLSIASPHQLFGKRITTSLPFSRHTCRHHMYCCISSLLSFLSLFDPVTKPIKVYG